MAGLLWKKQRGTWEERRGGYLETMLTVLDRTNRENLGGKKGEEKSLEVEGNVS